MKPLVSNKRFSNKRFTRLFTRKELQYLFEFTREIMVRQQTPPPHLQENFAKCAKFVKWALGREAHEPFVFWMSWHYGQVRRGKVKGVAGD